MHPISSRHRNVRFQAMTLSLLVVAVMSVIAASAVAEDGDGFKPLFNGHDLTGWDADQSIWSVRDGAITGECTPANQADHSSSCVWHDGEVDDFVLKASFKIDAGSSGIQFRSQLLDESELGGLRAQVDDGMQSEWRTGCLIDEKGVGVIGRAGEHTDINARGHENVVATLSDVSNLRAALKKSDWNDLDIIAMGNHITVKINGLVSSELTDEADKRALFGKLGFFIPSGSSHVTVQFKDIRLKRLKLSDKRHKIVLIAGEPSHGLGEHEFEAGIYCLRHCLDKVPGIIAADYYHGWPVDPTAFDNADAIMMYADGGGGHPAIQGDRLSVLGSLVAKGVGFGCCHYAVEVPKDHGGNEWLSWIGGYYENGFSANPVWTADYMQLPDVEVTRGVKPFSTTDEWYFNIHFRPDFKLDVAPGTIDAVIPILTGKPSDQTRANPYSGSGPYAQVVAQDGRTEVMMWTVENPNGHRGFGFTGGHFHKNWANNDQRKLILNALLWIAHADVPAGGVESAPTEMELNSHLRSRLAAASTQGEFNPSKAAFASEVIRHDLIDIDVDITGAKRLMLVVGDGGDGFSCDWADWVDPVLVGPEGTTKLTDLAWTSATTGYGAASIDKNVEGKPMRVAGQPVTGIGVHATSVITYNIAGKGFTRFKAKAGPDNGGTDQHDGHSATSIQFMIFIKK